MPRDARSAVSSAVVFDRDCACADCLGEVAAADDFGPGAAVARVVLLDGEAIFVGAIA